MKPKEIIEQANLSKGFDKKSQDVFFKIMSDELRAAYASYKVKDSDRHFVAAVKTLRSKWDGISKKIPYGLTDGVWGFFYARYAAPMKEELCPTWKKRNDEWIRKRDERLWRKKLKQANKD